MTKFLKVKVSNNKEFSGSPSRFFYKKNRITGGKYKHHVSLNELSTSESVGYFLKKKEVSKKVQKFKNWTFPKAIFFF